MVLIHQLKPRGLPNAMKTYIKLFSLSTGITLLTTDRKIFQSKVTRKQAVVAIFTHEKTNFLQH